VQQLLVCDCSVECFHYSISLSFLCCHWHPSSVVRLELSNGRFTTEMLSVFEAINPSFTQLFD